MATRTGQSRGGAVTAGDPIVSVDAVSKTYGTGEDAVTAVDDVTFDVRPGTVVGVLGPNGAGKTTLIKSMLGLIIPDEGEVTVDGVDVHEDTRAAYRRIGTMLEGARNVYWRLTVRENLRFFASLAGHEPGSLRDRHDELLEQLGLADKADVTVNDLSRGMKGKVALAAALARDAPVAFLDEPTLGLDVESSIELRRELRRLAEQESMTIVLSSHDMAVVEDVCDRVIVMNEGRIVADDAVESLIDLFRTQAYRVTVAEDVPAATRESLATDFLVESWDEVGHSDRFDVALPGDRSLYDLMDRLRAANLSIERITAIEPDLEDVFLELTENDAEGPGDDDR
ncbi:MAG: ATP-binding cassette domain-containing protein [Halanaeroarchaeum sp.]